MTRTPFSPMTRTAAAVLLALASACAMAQDKAAPAASAASAPAEAARPEVAKLLTAAQALLKESKPAEALGKLREVEAIGNLSPYEQYHLDRTRGAAALGVGDNALAIKSVEAALATGRITGADLRNNLAALSDLSYRGKNYKQAVGFAQRYFKEGGTDPAMRNLLIQAMYLGDDYAGTIAELKSIVQADEAAGRVSTEPQLRLLASAQLKAKDLPGYTATLERIAARYPSKEIWAELAARLERQPNFADRLRLDLYRLMQATGTLEDGASMAEMAQLAMQAGFPAEASKVLEDGYARGLLGKGNDAKHHAQLREQARKAAAADAPVLAQSAANPQSAKDGNVLANVGLALATTGQAEQGAALIEQGLAKGVKRPEDARLHLGVVQYLAGKKEAAAKTLRSVQGADGTADLARLWALVAQAPAAAPKQ